MWYILYFFIAIGATTAGSLTGMGGGIIIKPLMDLIHQFDVETIGVLSSITVFAMSSVSIGRQIIAKQPFPFQIAVPLSIGSVLGGYLGEKLLGALISGFQAQGFVTITQNAILAALILCIYFYMRNKSHIQGLQLSGVPVSLAVGCFLGICSSFLGIGGGPINVALIIYLYSVSTKTATVCSLMTILFAQISKLATVALSTGFLIYDLSVAPAMVAGAIAGGFIGASLNKRCSEQLVEQAFNGIQLLVLAITVFNIVRNLMGF